MAQNVDINKWWNFMMCHTASASLRIAQLVPAYYRTDRIVGRTFRIPFFSTLTIFIRMEAVTG